LLKLGKRFLNLPTRRNSCTGMCTFVKTSVYNRNKTLCFNVKVTEHTYAVTRLFKMSSQLIGVDFKTRVHKYIQVNILPHKSQLILKNALVSR
jgi:hypothetical protein